jgi:hypothetical protein
MESRSVAAGSSQEQVVSCLPPYRSEAVGSTQEQVACLVPSAPAASFCHFVPKFSRSVTTSKRSYQQFETILAPPVPTPRIRPRAVSITAAFVEEGQ